MTPEAIRMFMKLDKDFKERKASDIAELVFDKYVESIIEHAAANGTERTYSVYGSVMNNLIDNRLVPSDLRYQTLHMIHTKFAMLGFGTKWFERGNDGWPGFIVSWKKPWWKFWGI